MGYGGRKSTGRGNGFGYNSEKKGAKTVAEHAGIGCFGVEAGKTDIAASSCISTACNSFQDYTIVPENVPYRSGRT